MFKNPNKRYVVAQSLDYGAALWKHSTDFNDFISILDNSVQKTFNIPLNQKLKEYYGLSEEELDQLMNTVKNNLNDGILHFVVLMDSLDSRLKDLILYVNQNSQFDMWNAPHSGDKSPEPFDKIEKRAEILQRLGKIKGAIIDLDNVNGFSGLKLPLRVIADKDARNEFFSVCLWIENPGKLVISSASWNHGRQLAFTCN